MTILKAACIQLSSGPDMRSNLEIAESLIREAAADGAKFIATPENTCFMRAPLPENKNTIPAQKDHPAVPLFSALAQELDVWLLAGSLKIEAPGGKIFNRSFLFSDRGDIAATYDKIHMFDVDLPTGEKHRESDNVKPGKAATLAKTPWGKLGMTICYDVRFAYLYRALAQAGADIITIPSAFTVPTGKAHWSTLLRTRAIETGSFILAPAQTGTHYGDRKTWGHSMILGPWGDVLAEADQEIGIITADLHLDQVVIARQSIPALTHDRKIKIQNF